MTSSVTKVLTPEEYATRHKQAFRIAFDFLNAHFPPVHNDEWWTKLSEDCSIVSYQHRDNTLLTELLMGVLAYLETESKMRKGDEYGSADD